MADERAHDREPLSLDVLLYGVRDVAEAVAGPALLDGGEQRALGARNRRVAIGETKPTGKVRAASATHPSYMNADVDREDVAARELVGPGNAVHDDRVGDVQEFEPGNPR